MRAPWQSPQGSTARKRSTILRRVPRSRARSRAGMTPFQRRFQTTEPEDFCPAQELLSSKRFLALAPRRITRRALVPRSFQGVSRSKSWALATFSRNAKSALGNSKAPPLERVTAKAPSRMVRVRSATTERSLAWRLSPWPEQPGQAPTDELNENSRGSRGGTSSPQEGQVRWVESKRTSSPAINSKSPAPTSKACCTLSLRRAKVPEDGRRRSTITSMSCNL